MIYVAVTPAWQIIRALVYWRGSRISETTEKKAGVPEYAKTSVETALIASAKEGFPTILKSETQTASPCGASAGRPWTPTAMVTMNTDN